MKRILKIFFKLYIYVAVLIGTFFMYGWVLVGYNYFLANEYLPNGYVLTPTGFDRSNIQLIADGKQVSTHVGAVMWCNDVVYGVRYDLVDEGIEIKGKKYLANIGYLFIYAGNANSFWQYKKSLSYSVEKNHYTIFFSDGEKNFNKKLSELNVPKFDLKKSVGFLDLNENLVKISKDEVCRQTGDRDINP